MILFINIIAEGGGVVVKERTELVLQLNYNHVYKKSLLRSKIKKKRPFGASFPHKKTHRATAVVFYIAHIHTHTHLIRT